MQVSVFLLHVPPDDAEDPAENPKALGSNAATDARCLGY